MLISVQTFNTLFHGFPKMSDLALWNGVFHAANQPLVPEATPAPGFERPTLHKMTSQDIAAGKRSLIFLVNIFTYLGIKTVGFLTLAKAEKMMRFHLTCCVWFVLFLSS